MADIQFSLADLKRYPTAWAFSLNKVMQSHTFSIRVKNANSHFFSAAGDITELHTGILYPFWNGNHIFFFFCGKQWLCPAGAQIESWSRIEVPAVLMLQGVELNPVSMARLSIQRTLALPHSHSQWPPSARIRVLLASGTGTRHDTVFLISMAWSLNMYRAEQPYNGPLCKKRSHRDQRHDWGACLCDKVC